MLVKDCNDLTVHAEAPLRVLGDKLAALGHRARSTLATAVMVAEPAQPSEPPPASDDFDVAVGEHVTIHFNGKRCIHSRFCVLWEPQVYKANTPGAWIDANADSAEALIAVAHNCPSGAITYSRNDGGDEEAPPRVNLINLRENGPLAIRAEIVLGGEAIGTRATLCRCGKSKHKPYCDGSHNDAGFVASGEAKTIETEPLPKRDGLLMVDPQPNGPLRVSGPLEICCGTGRTIKRTMGEMLCRCGGSANKPFCDGTHARIGFVAH
jgi:CDGSH-type Zn-finger protein/uncharacterized Fe-S cluster protein YjdI